MEGSGLSARDATAMLNLGADFPSERNRTLGRAN